MLSPTIDSLHGQILALLCFQRSLLEMLSEDQRVVLTGAFISDLEERRREMTAINNSEAAVNAFDNTTVALVALM